MVVVNELAEPVTIRVDLGASGAKGTALGWVLDGADYSSKQVRWNGEPGHEGGGGPFPFDTIAPYAASFDPSAATLNLPPHSASGIVFH